MSFLVDASYLMIKTFSELFNFLTQPVTMLLRAFGSSFTSFLLTLMEFTGLDALLEQWTFFEFLLGSGALVVLAILIVYFFIP